MANMTWRDAEQALQVAITDPATGWSLGTFGALAEFHRSADEIADAAGLRVLTPRGGIEIRMHDDIRILPYEGLSKLPTAWTHGVMVCLPEASSDIGSARGLTELGPDTNALIGDKDELLFDLGLGVAHLLPCLRTGDAELIDTLRAHLETPFLELPSNVVAAIKAAQPVRVFQSRLGRIEVLQQIPESGGETPLGPHTHILPELLGRGRTQSANVPVPDGWVPCLAFFPPNSARDVWGERQQFERDAHTRFQGLIDAFAPDEIKAAKHRVWQAMITNTSPGEVDNNDTRAVRTAIRVALRQWRHLEGDSALWRQWHERYEPNPDGS